MRWGAADRDQGKRSSMRPRCHNRSAAVGVLGGDIADCSSRAVGLGVLSPVATAPARTTAQYIPHHAAAPRLDTRHFCRPNAAWCTPSVAAMWYSSVDIWCLCPLQTSLPPSCVHGRVEYVPYRV